MLYTSENLLVRGASHEGDVLVHVDPKLAGWRYLTFEARRLSSGSSYAFHTLDQEVGVVILSGSLNVDSPAGKWENIGVRSSVFEGLPYALYFPRHTSFSLTANTPVEIAVATAPTDQDHAACLISPADIGVEIRGGGNATRQINNIIPPGFDCHRLVLVEVYTPGGNWSSYPPHKHDTHRLDSAGILLEAALEEIYFYKIDLPNGFAMQRIYTDDNSPIHHSNQGFDALVVPTTNDVVLVPAGYHPVSSPPGYTTYYLNALAGSAQSLANFEDPHHAWTKTTFHGKDLRVPIY